MTGRAKTVGQVIAVSAVVGLLVLLGWKLAFGNGGGASAELAGNRASDLLYCENNQCYH